MPLNNKLQPSIRNLECIPERICVMVSVVGNGPSDLSSNSLVGLGCRTHQLHLCRGVTPHHTHTHKTSVLDMTLNKPVVRP